AYRKIRGQGESFLFESVEGGEHLGRYSFVGCNPRGMIRQTGDTVEWIEGGQVRETYTVVGRAGGQAEGEVRDGLEVVEKILANYRPVDVNGLPRFTGGAIGFVGHEFIHDIEPVVPRPPEDELGTPTICFLIADQLLVFDRVAQTLTIIVNGIIGPGESLVEVYERATG
ncbi:MAG: anthranilate synthase component I, partial [Actinomycetales bacterium]|nr:anthranilate synthase component I [Actinomycetales bacterium]